MADIKSLKRSILTPSEMPGMPEAFREDYLNTTRNIEILATNFQLLKSGTQAVTGVFSPITGWSLSHNRTGFNYDSSTGEVTIPEAGMYVLDAHAFGDAATGIEIKAQLYTSAWVDIDGSHVGNPNSAVISGLVFAASLRSYVRVMVMGGAMDIAENMAKITLRRTG